MELQLPARTASPAAELQCPEHSDILGEIKLLFFIWKYPAMGISTNGELQSGFTAS